MKMGLWRILAVAGAALLIPACGGGDGAAGTPGASGAPGMGASSAVDRIVSLAGLPITSVPESLLTPLPLGATTRRVTILNAVLRADAAETSPVIGVYHAYIATNPVAGSYAVTIIDPATGIEFPGSGFEIVHLYVASFFTN